MNNLEIHLDLPGELAHISQAFTDVVESVDALAYSSARTLALSKLFEVQVLIVEAIKSENSKEIKNDSI